MAAASALNVVKQIQALAEGPRMPEMRECLGQVVTSLLFFIDHPDSRVRLKAARALLTLSEGYAEEMRRLDLGRARSALARCREQRANGTVAVDTEELEQLLAELFKIAEPAAARPVEAHPSAGDAAATTPGAAAAPPAADPAAGEIAAAAANPASSSTSNGVQKGEVILQVGAHADGTVKAAILEKVVALIGVVSVTFEGPYVIISTRTPKLAADAAFLADLFTAVKSQGLQDVSLCTPGSVDLRTSPEPGCTNAGSAGAHGSRPQSPDFAPEASPAFIDDDDEEAEPAYLDDDDEIEDGGTVGFAGAGGAPMGPQLSAGGANWSFFSQTNWMTGRKVQEFEDDPTIAARLAKAKLREEERKKESQTKIGRLSSWLTGR